MRSLHPPCSPIGSSPRGRGTRNTVRALAWRSAAVHPRAGGDTTRCKSHPGLTGRRFIPARAGNTRRRRATATQSRRRFIPARAGNTCHASGVLAETIVRFIPARAGNTAQHGSRTSPVCRFIPARAGNTHGLLRAVGVIAVHPRAGGEHSFQADPPTGTVGSSPLTGNTVPRRACVIACGSSPRGRGTHRWWRSAPRWQRFIPARAGNTTALLQAVVRRWTVHPRVGGEHPSASPDSTGVRPPTVHPRAGGEHLEVAIPSVLALLRRFIPARAGNTGVNVDRDSASAESVHPRAGGEHSISRLRSMRLIRFIPARAGNTAPTLNPPPGERPRFIPARAGNT